MTDKLYYIDSHLKESESEIVDIIEKDNKILVVLDKTPFYPEGGGQPSDTGYINNVRVNYVYEKNDIVYHEVENALPLGKVKCCVDFERRMDLMQQHSGEHLISGIIYKLYKGNNKGFHLGEDYVTLDVDIYPFTEDMIEEVEKYANKYIYSNEQFITYIVDKESLNKTPSRKKIDVSGDIRIVEAKGMDCCPCCGTHVKSTGEIGIIKILKVEKYKGMSRIYLKCGKRAYEDFKNKHEIVTSLSRKFSTDEKSIINNINKQCEEIANLKRELNDFKIKLAQQEAAKLMGNLDSPYVCRNYENKTFEEIKYIAEVLEQKSCIFIGASLKDKKILFINNHNKELKCGKIFKEHIREFSGKGGGKDNKAQGSFDSIQNLQNFYDFLCKKTESMDRI